MAAIALCGRDAAPATRHGKKKQPGIIAQRQTKGEGEVGGGQTNPPHPGRPAMNSAQSRYMELTDSPCAMRRMVSAIIWATLS
jgi:hypothetical protein